MKKIAGLLIGSLFLMNTALAQEVTVEGLGTDKDGAVKDAMRNAVETVVGSYVDSNTLVENSIVSLDEIYLKSQGFVKNIRVLNEREDAQEYWVKALVDVDTAPDATLLSRLNTIMLLNDPRIAVLVQKQVKQSVDGNYSSSALQADEFTESVMNEKLMEMGFQHIVDPQVVAQLKESSLIGAFVAEGNVPSNASDMYGIDYLVLGTSSVASNRIQLPSRKDGGDYDSPLTTGRAMLAVKVIKFDTGEIVASYTVDGQAVDNGAVFAQNKATTVAAQKACVQLESKFKKIAAQPFSGIRMVITADNDSLLTEIVDVLKQCYGVQSVRIREQNGAKTVIEVESTQKPSVLIRSLKERTKAGIFVEKVSNNSAELVVS